MTGDRNVDAEGLGIPAVSELTGFFHHEVGGLQRICILRETPERAIGADRPAGRSLGEDRKTGRWGLAVENDWRTADA